MNCDAFMQAKLNNLEHVNIFIHVYNEWSKSNKYKYGNIMKVNK